MKNLICSLRSQSQGRNRRIDIYITYLFVVPIMIEANRFLLIYNPGFDFAHYILHKIEEKVNSRWTLNI